MDAIVLQNLRKTLGLTVQEIALKSGLSVSELVEMETGGMSPSRRVIEEYADILNVKPDLLRVFLVGTDRKVPGFNTLRSVALQILNGYLALSLWMMAFNEDKKTVPH